MQRFILDHPQGLFGVKALGQDNAAAGVEQRRQEGKQPASVEQVASAPAIRRFQTGPN